MTETEIRAEILAYLNTLPNCEVRAQQKHTKNRASLTKKGWPDLSGYYKTKGLFIEVKKPGGALSLEQHTFITNAKSNGHIAFFAVSLEDVKQELREYH